MDALLTIWRAQRPIAWYFHAQVVAFWIASGFVAAALPDTPRAQGFTRLYLALYPLLSGAALVVWQDKRLQRHSYFLTVLAYGFLCLILFNPQQLGWLPHVLLLQTYFSAAAVWAHLVVDS